jgi:hypothetical protein
MRRFVAVIATVAGVLALTSACGSSSGAPSAGSTGPKIIDITFSGTSVTPSAEIVQIAVGQDVELDVHADDSGEIHVHSTPAQEVEYHAGTTQHSIGSFTTPGDITVESHTLDKTIVILRVQ